ncbi:Fic family protein [Comamonas testosteroni]|uniref:Fic family protein n=1 Tax=Comamonas testosteroni TaxID=285 RepID=UPI0026EB45A9|nr:Fic family protein [Comamonas testosteroni]
MNSKPQWIWQQPGWPTMAYDEERTRDSFAQAYRMHGMLEGKAQAIGFGSSGLVAMEALSDEVISTAAIEGERFSKEIVRSSVMRKMGLAADGPVDRSVDGLVDVITDAMTNSGSPLDADRLCRWQSALFPGGTSSIFRVAVGRFRESDDPMQIVSGKMGRETVHYEAPPSSDVPREMERFLKWFDESSPANAKASGKGMDGFARAAIAHLWFESIHPFEDGNGRVGRAIVDMAMAQHLREPAKLYSLSRQLLQTTDLYHDQLNAAQRGGTDVTQWVDWFAQQSTKACMVAMQSIDQAIEKRRFWEQHDSTGLHERQRKVLQRLLDAGDSGFEGGLSADKYTRLAGVSKATATRDLSAMVETGQLWTHGVGRGLRYYVNIPGWSHGMDRSSQDVAATEHVAAQNTRQAEQDIREMLEASGYSVSHVSGPKDRFYIGPIIAVTDAHVAQDMGRRQVVLHEVHSLDKVPGLGERMHIQFKGGRGTVTSMQDPSRDLGR